MCCHGYMQAHVYDLPQHCKNKLRKRSKDNCPICDVTLLETDLNNIIVLVEWVSEWVSECCLTPTPQVSAIEGKWIGIYKPCYHIIKPTDAPLFYLR